MSGPDRTSIACMVSAPWTYANRLEEFPFLQLLNYSDVVNGRARFGCRFGSSSSSLPLQHQPAFGLDRRCQTFGELAEEPRQRDLQMHVVVRHIDRTARGLPHGAHAE